MDRELKKPKSETFQLILGLLVTAGLGFGLYRLTVEFFTLLQRADPTIGAAIVAAVGTILVGVGGGLVTQYQVKKRQAEESHREEKLKLYISFVEAAANQAASSNENLKFKAMTQDKLVKFMFDFKTKCLVRGSPSVIRALQQFESATSDDRDVLIAIDKVYREMRKDIGLSNWGLRRGELVATYLKHEDRKHRLQK
jgi:hypothetical protein